jgi:hypothetical protein
MKIDKLKKLIEAALIELDRELGLHQTSTGGVSSVQQLERFRSNLQLIHDEVDSNTLTGRQFGMSRAIVDSWPFNSKLGELIVQAETEYKKHS